MALSGIKKAHRRGNDETKGVDNDRLVDQEGKRVCVNK